jgi:class 3 adenylate cyclase
MRVGIESSGKLEASSSTVPRSRLLTFLIADVRDYTRLTAEQGDEAAARLASRCAELCDGVVASKDGDVIELRGDEVLAVFPSACDALRAAVGMQQTFRQAVADDPPLPLKVGIGLDAGEAIPVKGAIGAALLTSLPGSARSLAEGRFFAARR